MESKQPLIRKYSCWPEQDTAVGYYRLIQPARFLKRMKLAGESRTVPFSGYGQAAYRKYSDRTFMEICEGSDVFHTTLLWRQEDLLKCLNLRKHFGLKWVVDIDDNIFASSSDNPAKDTAGMLNKNRQLCLQMADGVTVSVPSLKELYAPYNAHILVQPNSLDLALIENARVPAKPHRKLRIAWRGAYGHKYDLELVRPVIEALRKEFDFDFVVFGTEHPFADEHVSWVPFFQKDDPSYYKALSRVQANIALVPLVDSAYNRCKSNLACLEWSALGVPLVISPTVNQADVPALQASTNFEWYEAIASLLRDKALRKSQAERQLSWVREHYDMRKAVVPLASWLADLPRRTDMEP